MSHPPPLLELPVHLVSVILSQLDSMQSLGSAVLSHSLFYHSLRDDKNDIVRRILKNQIPYELVHYAEAAFKAKFVDNDSFKDVRIVLESAFKRVDLKHNNTLSQDWCLNWIFTENEGETGVSNASDSGQHSPSYGSMDSISIASAISKTHWLVEHFCGCFIRERLPLMRELMGGPFDSDDFCPSQVELFRIKRALYRYQIFCSLIFRSQIDFDPGKLVRQKRNSYLQQHFFHSFPPWVNEQLCCIHDYLEDVLSSSFDEVAAHDIEWGASSVDWLAKGRRNEHKQALLTYGLSFLFELRTSRNYEHRRRLLQSKGLPRTTVALAVHLQRAVPTQFARHLFPPYTSLLDAIAWLPWNNLRPGSLDPELTREKHLMKEWPGAHDAVDAADAANSQTFQIWLVVHRELLVNVLAYCPDSQCFRKCGYVIWDVAVPESVNLFWDDELYQRFSDARERVLMENIERQRGRDQMRRSWKERAAIRAQGGRGYWESGHSIVARDSSELKS